LLACVFVVAVFGFFGGLGVSGNGSSFLVGVVAIGIWNASKNLAELIAEVFLGRISKSLEAVARQ
jgi:hypothetical protein